MRVAQVAPLYESVPPDGYGATERIVLERRFTSERMARDYVAVYEALVRNTTAR